MFLTPEEHIRRKKVKERVTIAMMIVLAGIIGGVVAVVANNLQ